MMSLTLKEILLYNNQRIKMLLQNNIQLLEILSNIKQKDKEYKLYSLIKFQYNKKKYSFNFVHIIEKNKEVKGIIHTSNYELSTWIQTSIKDSRLIFHDSDTREKSLTQHISSEYSTIIVSPSMITGIDLKDDLSRFQIILKVL